MNSLLFITLASFFGYMLTNRRKYKYEFATSIDQKIKISPNFIYAYILLYPLVVFTFIILSSSIHYKDFLWTTLICNVLATLCWYFFPNGLKRNKLKGKTTTERLLNFIYAIDGDTNGFPSMHVFLSTISSYYLCLNFSSFIVPIVTVCTLIAISTVYVKQHYIIDIAGGVIIGFLSITIVSLLSLNWL